jgi:hypothetical protein
LLDLDGKRSTDCERVAHGVRERAAVGDGASETVGNGVSETVLFACTPSSDSKDQVLDVDESEDFVSCWHRCVKEAMCSTAFDTFSTK